MVDLYCERTGPHLWAEPTNAITNLAFIIAAVAIWLGARRARSLSFDLKLLIGLILAIALGSALFHTFATRWAMMLDIVPILLFQIVFIWFYGRKHVNLPVPHLLALIVMFAVAVYLTLRVPHMLNGSIIYLPALMVLVLLGFHHLRQARDERALLLWASAVFMAALIFRTLDTTLCEHVPLGTHFLWHLCNGIVVYLVARSLFTRTPDNTVSS